MANDITDISSRNINQTCNKKKEVMFDFICNWFVNNLITTGMLRYNDKPMKSNVIMGLLRCAKIFLGSFIHLLMHSFIFHMYMFDKKKYTEKKS